MSTMLFKNREQAGHQLAAELEQYAGRDEVIVLGLPRGGVPVAAEVARHLHAPLDVLVVRKLGLPGWEELAMGAIASGGIRVLNRDLIRRAGVSDEVVNDVIAAETRELHRRETAYREHTGAPDVRMKTVILVDDGIATGSTVKAAVHFLCQQNPAKIIIAVPTTSEHARHMLEPMVDEFISLITPKDFRAVGQWYEDFSQTSDAEVRRLLAGATPATTALN